MDFADFVIDFSTTFVMLMRFDQLKDSSEQMYSSEIVDSYQIISFGWQKVALIWLFAYISNHFVHPIIVFFVPFIRQDTIQSLVLSGALAEVKTGGASPLSLV